MHIELKPWHAVVFIALLVLFGLTRTSISPYANNHLKPHRWRTEVCTKAGYDAIQCMISLPIVQVQSKTNGKQEVLSTEVPQYDICLEHGEWKRIK